jgi:transcription antitermination factor NusG
MNITSKKIKQMLCITKSKLIILVFLFSSYFSGYSQINKQNVKNGLEIKNPSVISEEKGSKLECASTANPTLVEFLTETKKGEKKKEEIKVGSKVKLLSGKQTGVVEEIQNNRARVIFGNLKTLASLETLEVVD